MFQQKDFFYFTEKCIIAINLGIKEMVSLRKFVLTPEFILVGLLEQDDSPILPLLKEMELDAEQVADQILSEIFGRSQLGPLRPPPPKQNQHNITMAKEVEVLFEKALNLAKELDDKYVGAGTLFLAMFQEGVGEVREILHRMNLEEEAARRAYMVLRGGKKIDNRDSDSTADLLSFYTTDLTAMARHGKLDPVIGREEEIMQIIRVLSRRKKNNPVIIGPPGVGKTVLVEGLAQRIVNAEVPDTLLGKRVVSLEMAELIAGAKFKGDFEERLKGIREEIIAASGSIILFIDEFHTVMWSSSSEEGAAASNMLKPALARGLLQCVGATTLDEYKRYIENDKALERRLQPILIREPTIEETIQIMQGLKERYQQHHQILYSDEAIETATLLSNRYISGRFQPDKTIDVLDEAGASLRLVRIDIPLEIRKVESEKKALQEEQERFFSKKDFKKVAELQQKILLTDNDLKTKRRKWEEERAKIDVVVTGEDVAQVISRMTGIPLTRLVESEARKLTSMEKNIHRRIIGQDQAIHAVCNAIRRNRAGLKLHNRPIGSFLFLGPTGVGKTELAKALAEFLLDDENKIIRLDMSEYQESHTVSRMIGSPPGYVGYGEGGQLTERVRRNPYSVVLLDEIEKAHPDVFNLFLQILDDGKLTDGQGLEVSFKNTSVIGTSNIAGHILSREVKRIGFVQAGKSEGYEETKKEAMDEVKKFFRPEFLNRLDDIIVFHPLSMDHIEQIADLELDKLRQNLQARKIHLDIDDRVKKLIIEAGFSETFGARPLKREIERRIENPISQNLIEGKIHSNMKIRLVVNSQGSIEIVSGN